MIELEEYQKLLKARAVSKRIQQLSWNLMQLEKRFMIEQLEPFEYPELLKAYEMMNTTISECLNELKGIYTK